jgi:hypothetical protein
MPTGPQEGRPENRSSTNVRVLIGAALLLLSASRIALSQAPAATQPQAAPTLHVYTNLRQVPVLVLTKNLERMKPLDESKFRLSLDSGPLFRPTHVRQEGDEPISLSILIDAGKPENELLSGIAKGIASLSPNYLHAQDHVSIYVLDCSLIQTASSAPAEAATLEHAVDQALSPWQYRQTHQPSPACTPSMPLWDSMATILDDLARQPGRRVLLALTDGHDSGSKTLWKNAMNWAQVESIAVFGLRTVPVAPLQATRPVHGKVDTPPRLSPEDQFNQICQLTGGVEVPASGRILSDQLKELLQMVRERYIVEFPRGREEQAGIHTLDVYFQGKRFYIHSTGDTATVATTEEVKAATTLKTNSSWAPVVGHRTILRPSP